MKRSPAAPSLALACCAYAACATSSPSTPRHYPALPPQADATRNAFTPDGALTALTLACDAAEPTLANALDDDCDGKQDGQAGELLALAYPRSAPLALSLVGAQGVVTLAPDPCDEPASFCAAHLALSEVARGNYTLTAKRADGAPATASSVLVSLQSQGKVSAYLATIAADQSERALGQLTVP